MLADWAEENGADVDYKLMRGDQTHMDALDIHESEIYRFLDRFSGRDDFLDWISYVNPIAVWDENEGEEVMLEDIDWEENFL